MLPTTFSVYFTDTKASQCSVCVHAYVADVSEDFKMLLKKVYLILLMVAALAVFSGSNTASGNILSAVCKKCKFQNAQEHFNCEFYLGNFTSFKIEPSERTIALIGDTISFVCNVEPDMDNCATSCITWEHNDTEVTTNSSISANNLTLINIQYSHSGNYCCTANGFMDCVNLTVTGMLV